MWGDIILNETQVLLAFVRGICLLFCTGVREWRHAGYYLIFSSKILFVLGYKFWICVWFI